MVKNNNNDCVFFALRNFFASSRNVAWRFILVFLKLSNFNVFITGDISTSKFIKWIKIKENDGN